MRRILFIIYIIVVSFSAQADIKVVDSVVWIENSPSTTPAPIDLTCNFPIGSEKDIKLDPATGSIDVIDAEGEKHTYKIDKSKPTTTLKDSKGDTYKIDNKTGKVTPMGSQAPSSGPNAPPSLAQTSSIDPSLATIVWNNPPDAKGGLDQGTTKEIADAFKAKYAPAILNSNISNLSSNFAPFKIVPANGIDNIQATITINSPQLNKDSIRFITLSGSILNATKSNNTYTVTLNGLDHAKMELVAVQAKDLKGGWQVIGKLIQRNYQEDNRTLTLIPLGNATISNKSEIETELKKQYGIANGNWTVNVADALPLPTGWKDKATIDIDAGALSCYSAEMKEIIRAYNSKVGITEPKKEEYYIFVSNIPSKNTAVEGEMPRGEHYGFIFSPNPKPKTVVHELGHGAYFFEHFWDEVKGIQKGATSNIMDYTTNPTDLRVFQWDDIHERPADFISPCWKSDEAGRLNRVVHLAIAPNGKIMDDFFIDNKEIVPLLQISNDNYYIASLNYNKIKYTWNNGGFFENGTSKITFKKNTKLTNQVNIVKPLVQKCKYQYITIEWKKEDEISENLVARIESKIPSNATWLGYPYADFDSSCVNSFVDEVKNLDKSCPAADITSHTQTLIANKTSSDPLHLTNTVNSVCLDAIRNLSYKDIMLYFSKIAAQTTIKETSEVALLRLMSGIKTDDYQTFFNELEKENAKLLVKLVKEIDDASINFFTDKKNYTNFIGGLCVMYRQKPREFKLDDNLVFLEKVVSLTPVKFKETHWASSYTGNMRFNYSYNESDGKITIYQQQGKMVSSGMGEVGEGWENYGDPYSPISPLQPIQIVLEKSELPIVQTALNGAAGDGSTATYIVPAIFLKYLLDKQKNNAIEKGAMITIDAIVIYASGGTALAANVGLARRVWALTEVAGAVGNIGLNMGTIDPHSNLGKTIEYYNLTMMAIGGYHLITNAPKAIKGTTQYLKNATGEIKSIIKNGAVKETLRNNIKNYKEWLAKLKTKKANGKSEYDDLTPENRAKIDKQEDVIDALDDVSVTGMENPITNFNRLSNSVASSLDNSVFTSISGKLDNQGFIRFDNNQFLFQSPKSFLNEKSTSLYDFIFDGLFYVKYDLSDGRILFANAQDGTYYAFVQNKKPLIIQSGQNVDDIIKTHLITQINKLKILAGLTNNRSVDVLGQLINPSTTKVTTFIGRMDDINRLKAQLGDFKNIDLGENIGGINILNRPDVVWESAGYNGWIRQHNMPWAKRVVSRTDDVYVASDPDDLKRLLEVEYNNVKVPTISAYEIRELIRGNLKPKNVSDAQWQGMKIKIQEFENANKFINY